MLRLRRYRVFLFFAVIFIFLVVQLRKKSDWSRPLNIQDPNAPPQYDSHKHDHIQTPSPIAQQQSIKEAQLPTSTNTAAQAVQPVSSTSIAPPAAVKPVHPESILEGALPDRTPVPPTKVSGGGRDDSLHAVSPPGRQEFSTSLAEVVEPVHWKRQAQHFPIPAESLIKLPTGTPMTIPRIQHKFNDETTDAKINREQRQARVKQEFKKAWTGYKTKAWLHDELSPVTGNFRDPFCGWAATLVDTLDTLWIMDLQEEFEEAVKAVDLIDFTTSPRNDIPMFETTIRYLGGLVAAYDVSGAKYKTLLAKAVELAEILIGAFDTPNRMPVLFYHWMPAYASQAHRASRRSNLAELGSLSLEFTRLAQLTKDPKYYDAVARVTIALSEWQDRGTKLYGVFPENVDASGCNRTLPALPQLPVATNKQQPASIPGAPEEGPVGYQPSAPETVRQPVPSKSKQDSLSGPDGAGKARTVGWDDLKEVGGSKRKRTLEPGPDISAAKVAKRADAGDSDCVEQGLDSALSYGADKFSMGGGQDSTYEYFPKQYLLLGGLDEVYHKMYIKTIDAVRKWMLYRPMTPDNRDILFAGSVLTSGDPSQDLILSAEVEHLTCFIGGMVGMGAKIFGIDGDLEIAKKLTDGCVWAYESTPTGVMPESALVLACQNAEDCTWNETLYWEYLDPMGTQRDQNVADYDRNTKYQAAASDTKLADEMAQANTETGKAMLDKASTLADKSSSPSAGSEAFKDEPASLHKRQSSPKSDVPKPITHNFAEDAPAGKSVPKTEQAAAAPASHAAVSPADELYEAKSKEAELELESFVNTSGHRAEKPLSDLIDPSAETWPDPLRPETHKEYVAARIKNEGLPPGFVSLRSKAYILRPEAIESVWYMYRITGDSTWQDKGWKMFESIINATSTEYGHSAIHDVTSESPFPKDEMESFWLAETLKYFYLLYSTPDTISLDEWVLNTEAHPFKRPTA
ncbi:class 1 alpha-mannosidase 1a [Diplocarpon rosae]|nr:class 1 alpha-mannosidase 1a [Diplocarpon rosae]